MHRLILIDHFGVDFGTVVIAPRSRARHDPRREGRLDR
jgi:hypothetical protein